MFYGTDKLPALGMSSERTELAIQAATQDKGALVGGCVSSIIEVPEVWLGTAGGALRRSYPCKQQGFLLFPELTLSFLTLPRTKMALS